MTDGPTTSCPPGSAPLAACCCTTYRKGGGVFATLRRIISAVFILLVIFFLGFYTGFLSSLGAGDRPTPRFYQRGTGMEKVAIVPINGMITGFTADYVRGVVDAILDDSQIKAVVLRIESPGGGATASDQILHELARLKTRSLPVIASYGGVAASGGYYVSCQADKIFAEPTCITGSIGVIAQVPTLRGLMEEKLGVKFETITATGSPEKQVGNNMYRDWNAADRAVMQKTVDAMHERFVEVVAEGRKAHLTPEQVASVADGTIYTAREALENKLIDAVGYLDAALAEARDVGGFSVQDPPVVIYQQPMSLMGLIGLRRHVSNDPVPSMERLTNGAGARQWLNEFSVPQIMMVMPL